MPAAPEDPFGPWNPGLNSTIPSRLMPRITLFDPAHSFVDWDEANALAEATGLDPQELAVTRPERLAFHSVLIRVTSQLYVPDGPNYADLGISLRAMAAEINDGFVVPDMEAVRAAYNAVANEAKETVAQLLDAEIYGETEVEPEARGLMARIFTKPPPVKPPPDPTERALIIANAWRDSRNEDMGAASRRAIARVLAAILNHRGALYVERETIAKVAVGLVLNRLGSAAVGRIVQHQFAGGVEALGYRWLPSQESPVVLNAKGASASGKSTIRSAQRGIAEQAGYDWRDFAIISPDYWRKALIDYDGLGPDFKYAAMLSGYELEVIDRKLDLLMAVKGSEGDVPHMLIDRFRFDSFQSDGGRAEDSTLLTRFGAKVYLFFLVTPPAATVERAWSRGLDTGRYKAVDDLLYHNVEAYSGMPDLFFRWAKGRGKWVQYEFLDNSVAQGELPRTIAYGQNGNLIVVDLERLCDIDRFREVHVDAQCSDGVKLRTLSGFEASAFFRRAVKELPRVDVLVPGGNEIYARSINGRISVDVALLPPGIEPEAFGDFVEASGGLGRLESHGEQELVGNC